MAKFILIAKYIFFVVVVFSAGLAIERLQGIKYWWSADSHTADDLVYNASSPLTSGKLNSILSKHYLKCLTQPSKPFCLVSANKRLEIFQSDQLDSQNVEEIEIKFRNVTAHLVPLKRRIHSLLKSFTRLMEIHEIKVVLIEPSMLFCLLSPSKRIDMLEKGFKLGRLKGSRNITTFGILDEDSKKLEMNNFTNEVLSAGFKIIKLRKWIGEESEKSFETVHYFFVLQDVAVHVVIFYVRNSYMWHSGLDQEKIDLEGLLFVNEGIFENFTILPLDLKGTSINQVFLPYDVQYFMKEIDSSKAVECKSNSSGIIASVTHLNLTTEQLHKRVVITLKELKTILAPQLAHFWLWSKSLLGWFVGCDIFYYSTELDLALTFKSVEGLNFTEILDENEFLKLLYVNKSESEFSYKLDCHGLFVNVFILHEDKDASRYSRSKEHRLTYPKFSLCSSQVIGQKILVPCNTEDIVKLEYEQRTNQISSSVSSKDNVIFSNETGS